jgi:hypothetical protein
VLVKVSREGSFFAVGPGPFPLPKEPSRTGGWGSRQRRARKHFRSFDYSTAKGTKRLQKPRGPGEKFVIISDNYIFEGLGEKFFYDPGD